MKKDHLFLEDPIYQVSEEVKNGRVTISRTSRGQVEITVRDTVSGLRFVKCVLSPHQFAEAITGLSETPCILETEGLENVGKTRQRKVFIFSLDHPIVFENKDHMIEYIKSDFKIIEDEEGDWILNDSFTGKGVQYKDERGERLIRANYVRYVEG